MSTEEEPEVNTVLDGLAKTVTSNNNGSQSGWIVGLVIAALAVVVIAIFAWKASRSAKELAKLKHEKDVLEEEKHQQELTKLISVLEEHKVEAQERIDALDIALQENDVRLQAELARHLEAKNKINSLTTWEAVDALQPNRRLPKNPY